MVEPVADGGYGMTAQWSDDYHHALHAFFTGERQGYYADFGSAEVLARTLTRVFRHDGGWSSFRGRDWGAPVDPERHDGCGVPGLRLQPRPGGQPRGRGPAVGEPAAGRAGRCGAR